jgi:hypothetical protein
MTKRNWAQICRWTGCSELFVKDGCMNLELMQQTCTHMINTTWSNENKVTRKYRVFRTQADVTLTHTSHKDTEQSTIEASVTLDGITLTDLLIRWSSNKWPPVCREIPQCLLIKCSGRLINLQNEHSICSYILVIVFYYYSNWTPCWNNYQEIFFVCVCFRLTPVLEERCQKCLHLVKERLIISKWNLVLCTGL